MTVHSNVIRNITVTVLLAIVILLMSPCAYAEKRNLRSSTDKSIKLELADSVLNYADNYLGAKYRRGSVGPNRFDCSGFTSYVFSRFGYDLNPSSKGQFLEGTYIQKELLMPGDLVFFGGSKATKSVGHVGIVVSVTDAGFKFIHASVNGVRVSNYPQEKYYSNRYIGARRVLPLALSPTMPLLDFSIKELNTGVSLLKLAPPIKPKWHTLNLK